MSQVIPWLDRKFNFDFPAGLHPNVRARVRGTPARLAEAVDGLSRQQLVLKHDGKWSIQEHAGHLLDEEDLFWRRLQEYVIGAESLSPALYENVELKHNERQIAAILNEFRAARERQTTLLMGLPAEDFARAAWHPRLKMPMRLVDHLFFIAEHDDHHLARIWELRLTCGPGQ